MSAFATATEATPDERNRVHIHVSAPTFESTLRPLGLGTATPRLSFKTAAPAGWRQRDWEAEATYNDGRTRVVRGTDRSAEVGTEQVLLDWPFEPLASRERVSVRVRVRGGDDQAFSAWGAAAAVEAGLLEASDWRAAPVGPAWPEEPGTDRRPALVRRGFEVRDDVVRARLYASAHGLYEAELNGQRIGDHELAPGWTKYDERLIYFTHDVTDLLREGPNRLGAWLGDGWYRGRLGFNGGYHDLYGQDLALIAQLEIDYADGTRETVATDGTWEAATGPILVSSLYDGEKYDARSERPGFSLPEVEVPRESGADEAGNGILGMGLSDWSPVAVGRRDPATLVAPALPPIRCTEELAPQSVTRLDDGRFLLDFGQNLVGRMRIRVDGPAGRIIELRHAEVLQDGDLYTRPLRLAEARDVLILDGGERVWEPRFTFHGFRYATVSGLDELREGDVVARVLHNDMARTGTFTTSNPDLNRLHENVVWGMRGNFVSVPTDCPQRDERLGWTGDIQVFAPTASFLYDCNGFLENWLADLAAEQLDDGTVPWFVPVIPGGPSWEPIETGAVWGDAAVLIPLTLHERFGDTATLARQYASGRAWVERMIDQSGGARLWRDAVQLGDWLDPAAPPEDPADARTDRYLVAQAYFAYSTRRFAEAAALLGRGDDAARYARVAGEARDAFRREYLDVNGLLTDDAQTAYALAIRFGLFESGEMGAAGERLAELVRAAGNRIATGFAGTPVICDALSATGQLETAYDLLLEDGCPSWLYTVRMGGTTIWERWDSMLPDGSINPGEMTSFNHYALGSVADWMHRVIGGLSPLEPGYRRIAWSPRPGGGLEHARVEFDSPYGRIEGSWERTSAGTRYCLSVPTGVEAVVNLPGGAPGTQVRDVVVLPGENREWTVTA